MSDEIVSINNLKENVLEFDLKVEGLNSDNLDAKFIIRSSGMDLAFPCAKDGHGKWSVKLPPLPMLERTAYPYVFSITAEGYHFEPLKGSINVIGSSDVYITNPKTKLTSPTPTQKVVEAKAVPIKVEPVKPTKSREKSIAQIAGELMEAEKKKPVEIKKVVVKQTVVAVKESLLPKITVEAKKEVKGGKDAAALKVLEDMGIRSKKAKAKSRFSLKD